jgi:uncharacterized protein YjbI with pentapeptide repeats
MRINRRIREPRALNARGTAKNRLVQRDDRATHGGLAQCLWLRGRGNSAIMPPVRGDVTMRLLRPVWLALAAFLAAGDASETRVSLKEVSEALAKAVPGHPADFAHRDLSYLDLSGLDFKQANLDGANLNGADLRDADLSGARLEGANLDHSVIIRTNFAGAKLAKASFYGAAAYSTLEILPAEAPNFAGADLTGARIASRLGRANLRGARLVEAHMGIDSREFRTNLQNDLSGCDLTGADLARADLRAVRLPFAHLGGADLTGADLSRADLAHADLSGADLTDADLTGANIEGAILSGVQGLERARGMARSSSTSR